MVKAWVLVIGSGDQMRPMAEPNSKAILWNKAQHEDEERGDNPVAGTGTQRRPEAVSGKLLEDLAR